MTDAPDDAPETAADAVWSPPELPAVVHGPAVARTIRSAGRAVVGAGVLLVAGVVVRSVGPGWSRALSDVLLVVGAVVAVAAGVGVLLALRGRGPRLRLDPTGFDNRTRPLVLGLVPGLGVGSRDGRAGSRPVRSAPWADVREVQAVREGGRRLLVITLADSRRSVVLLRRLADPPQVVEETIRERLDAANGYRPYGVIGAPPGAPRPL